MKNKKALSAVVSVVLMIALVLAATGVVFSIVKKTAEEKLKDSKSCFDIVEKFSLEDDYTCYNVSNEKVFVSISRKEILVDYLLISVSSEDHGITFKLYNEDKDLTGISRYPGGETLVSLPLNESGKTYMVDWNYDERPLKVQIAPSINKRQCDIVDQIMEIQNCLY